MTIRVTPIQTGWARMKAAQKCGQDGRGAFGRKLDIIRDTIWVGPFPILAWLVEHPEGRFVVDTGDTARNGTPGYLPWWNPFFRKMVQIKVAPVEEIGFQLHGMGIDPARDIAAVVLTHYHHDHTGGLDHFPHTRVIGPREGYQRARSFAGKVSGCLPQRWPTWFRPELVDLDGPAVGPFGRSHPLTRDGRVFLVPTPGHVAGHVAVVVRGEGVTYFLAGDATYAQDDLRAGRVDGVTADPAASLATLRAIAAFAADEPTVILPAHDPDGPRRLAAGEVFAPARPGSCVPVPA
ncbi:MAG: MBL fold metallo-hydrolase [Gemmataceae bacterium]|nr:MBL fold metallo-hydrolase [Gemmataceae bacterium]